MSNSENDSAEQGTFIRFGGRDGRRLDGPASLRLIYRSVVDPTTECWLWLGSKFRNGYGQFKYQGKMATAHRSAYLELVGEIPAGLEVMHSCDTRDCINPNHLRVGTHQENMREQKERGRCRNGFSATGALPKRDSKTGRFTGRQE